MFSGKYKGIVKDVQDPEKLGRVRCTCPQIMGASDSPSSWVGWAMPSMYFTSAPSTEYGSICVPEVGDTVWLEFEQGNLDFPIYVGGFPTGNSGGTSSVPALGKGSSDSSSGVARVVNGVEIPAATAGSSEYPKNRMLRTKAGHVVEIDDSTGSNRIRVRHSSGSFLEFPSSGSLVIQALQSFFLWAAASLKMAAVTDIILAAPTIKLGSSVSSRGVARLNDTVSSGAVTAMAGMVPVVFSYVPPGGGPPVVNPIMTISGVVSSASTTTFSD